MSSTLNFNIFNIFIISASFHGLIFAFIVLFSKKYNSKPGKYLAYFILFVSLNNIYFWFDDTNFIRHYKWQYFWHFPIKWSLLMFPTFFYFVWSYLDKGKFPKFYFYPFLVSFPILTIFFFLRIFYGNYPKSYDTVFFNLKTSFSLISMIFSVIAISHAIIIIRNHKKKNEFKIETKWLERLLFFTLLVIIFWVITYCYRLFFTVLLSERIASYILWIAMSLLTYRMGYLGIYHLGIFNQRKNIREELISETKNISKQGIKGFNRFIEIDNYLKNNKLYLDTNLTLTSLGETFNLSEGYLSQLINKNANTNFSTYINNLRIEKSKELLTNSNYKNYTIIAIALESGFNSKSSFYKAFKKITGISPSEFKKDN